MGFVLTAGRYIKLQEEYIKDEQRSLKRELVRAQEEIKRIQSVPLVIGQFMEAIDQKCVCLTPDKLSHANHFQHWYRTIVDRIQLCRAHSLNARP
jgi:ATP-dependent 26S proteasome regulatory subunit